MNCFKLSITIRGNHIVELISISPEEFDTIDEERERGGELML